MSSFLTLEDVNSVVGGFGASTLYHEIDTGSVGSETFDNVKIDFCIVSKSANTVSVTVENDAWIGAYYTLDSNGDYLGLTGNYNSSTKTLTFNTNTHIIIGFVCNMSVPSFNVAKTKYKLVEGYPLVLDFTELATSQDIQYLDLSTGDVNTVSKVLAEGVNQVSSGDFTDYIYVYLKKHDFDFNLTTNVLINGKRNTVSFVAPMVEEFDTWCKVSYLDKSSNFYLSDGSFIVDLTDYNSDRKVELTVELLESDLIIGKTLTFRLNVDYIMVDNFSDLYNEVVNGTEILELGADITCLSRIPVTHDLIIYGNEYLLDLNEHGFNINEDVIFKLEKVTCNNGDTAIKQGLNSKTEITDCTFTNCKSSNYNNLGSIIYCDVNLESLSVETDFTTIITDTTFINNHNCILHGGELTISGIEYHNTNPECVDNNNPAFLYQTDGTADIRNSVFDIDYDTNILCSDEINLGFAQCLVMCGETAIINTADRDYLVNNTLPFFDSNFLNRSHVFARYYYPAISACVVTSPERGKEDKSLCYCVSGNDWVFKENAVISRLDAGDINTIRKITWEE
jgi:hypothetical protein